MFPTKTWGNVNNLFTFIKATPTFCCTNHPYNDDALLPGMHTDGSIGATKNNNNGHFYYTNPFSTPVIIGQQSPPSNNDVNNLDIKLSLPLHDPINDLALTDSKMDTSREDTSEHFSDFEVS